MSNTKDISLLQLCTRWICNHITDVQTLSTPLATLPEDVVDQLLSQFMKTKTLTNDILLNALSASRTHLTLDGGSTWLSPSCFSTIATHCPSLHSLSLMECDQLDSQHLLQIVQSCKELRTLRLRKCPLVDDGCMQIISEHCPNLMSLDVCADGKITNKALEYISAKCTVLESINLGECAKISNKGLEQLAQLPHLRDISLLRCPLVKDNGLVPLAEGPAGKSLQILDISHCGQILDNGLKTIARLSQLKVLNMTGMLKISPVGIEDVCKSSPQLTAIYVGGCKQLTNEAVISILNHCKHLNTLDISFLDQITSDDAFMNTSNMKYFVTLVMAGVVRVTDVTIKRIAENAPNLQAWNLWRCGLTTDEGLAAIGQHCHQLVTLQLSDCSKITDKGVRSIALGCPALTTVILGGWATVSDEGVKTLTAHCKSIRTIDLGGLVAITNQSLRYLAESCPNLYSVSLYDCKQVNAEGVHNLVKAAPALQRLDLGGCCGVKQEEIKQILSQYRGLSIVS